MTGFIVHISFVTFLFIFSHFCLLSLTADPQPLSLRRVFVGGGRESVVLAADYSQLELRVIAHLSGTSVMSLLPLFFSPKVLFYSFNLFFFFGNNENAFLCLLMAALSFCENIFIFHVAKIILFS